MKNIENKLKKIYNKYGVKISQSIFLNKKPNIKDYIIFVDSYDGEVYKYNQLHHKVFVKGIRFENFYFTKVKDEIYNMWLNHNKDYPLIEDGNSFIPIQEEKINYSNYQGIIWFNKSQFQTDLDEYNNWKRWKENRNETRHQLEKDFGFDTKHGMHTCRLLRMGEEILLGQGVKVKRPDRDYLLAIRQGKVSYEDLVAEAELYDKELLDKAYKFSKLQDSVDKKIVVDILKEILKLK